MENASRALLMAGGILLVMLIIGLLIFSWGKFTEFYNKTDDLADITDLSNFNLQFTNYENRDVYGYELISLANKVADYNMRYSSAENSQNDQKYTPIKMIIKLNGHADKFNFGTIKDGIRNYESKQNSYFDYYNTRPMEQSTVRNDIISIIAEATGVEKFYRDSSTTTKLAKSINSLILTQEQIDYNFRNKNMTEEESKKGAVEKYKLIMKSNENITYNEMVNKLIAPDSNILKYYEYYQFKRGIFTCETITDNDYDSASGRIKEIRFDFTEKIE